MAMAILIAATAVTAIGQVSAANAQAEQLRAEADIANYNSKIADDNARRELEAASLEEQLQRQKVRRTIGAGNVARAKSGVAATGSSILVQDDSIIQGELDSLLIRHKGQLASNNYKSQSAIFKMQTSQLKSQAKNTKKAGVISAFGTILGGAAGAYGMGGGIVSSGATGGSGMSIPIDYSGYKSPL
jgi:uncharacterized protein involved in type VI secretion and phage assembly